MLKKHVLVSSLDTVGMLRSDADAGEEDEGQRGALLPTRHPPPLPSADHADGPLRRDQHTGCCRYLSPINTLRPIQNGCHFADNVFKCIFLNENFWISNNISLKCVPCGQIDNISSDNGLAPNRREAIIWTNNGLVNLRIYASHGLNEWTHWSLGNLYTF